MRAESGQARLGRDEVLVCDTIHAALDLLELRGLVGGETLARLRELLDRERAMLWRLGHQR